MLSRFSLSLAFNCLTMMCLGVFISLCLFSWHSLGSFAHKFLQYFFCLFRSPFLLGFLLYRPVEERLHCGALISYHMPIEAMKAMFNRSLIQVLVKHCAIPSQIKGVSSLVRSCHEEFYHASP